MNRPARVGALAGVVAPALLAVVFLGLTITERGFLIRAGWSPIRRTQVEWPSLLALGRYGLVLTATFVAAGALVITFAPAMYATANARSEKAAACALGIAGLALGCEAFSADRPGATNPSWHAQIHNGAYPAIPLGLVLAALTLAAVDRARTRVGLQKPSRLVLPLFALSIIATLITEIAQLARYFLFAAALAWLEAVALSVYRELQER